MSESRYQRLWEQDEDGYATACYDRQRADGTQPLIDNPTIEEVRQVLREYKASDVLEVGCGWGRLALQLKAEFRITGSDIDQPRLLRAQEDGLRVSYCDIARPVRATCAPYSMGFTRGVLHYLTPEELEVAKANFKILVRRAVLWEYANVCKAFEGDDFFILRPIVVKQE